MRILVAMMKHETNTFSPVVTDWARFEAWGAYEGEGVCAAYEGTAMPIGAYLGLAKAEGAEIITPIAAEAMPSGIVESEAYEHMARAITDAILREMPQGLDAIMLDLHGAMVSEATRDGEGTLLKRIRLTAPGVPVCVACDLHCNLTADMVSCADAIVGYKTYPHLDMYEAGERAGRILLAKIRGEARPVMAWGNRPLLAQTLRMGTDDEPMRSLMALAREIEETPGVLAATVFGGFPLADMYEAGLSAVVIADGDRALAERQVTRLLDRAWASREGFVYRGRPLAEAVAEAKALGADGGGPVILLDHADNTGSGGTEDVMSVIAEAIRQELDDVAVAAVCDPEAVAAMAEAGPGARVTLDLGGRADMPSIGLKGEPLRVSGRVKALSDGEWIVRGPMYTGVRVSTGPTAVLDTGRMEIVVVSRHHEPWDQGIFRAVGIEPETKRFLILKSRIHYRAGFGEIARATVTCDGLGVTTSDNSVLDYKRVRRPIFPLDRVNEP